jgi:hypothetical protein
MVWVLLISIAKEYILFALHLCHLCNYYIKGCKKLLTLLIIWQEASHWMLISILPLVGNLYWKRVFNKQTMTAICYWYDKWLNFDMHPMEMMAWSEFCWSLLQRSMQEVSYYLLYLRKGSTIVWQVCWFWHAIDGNDGTVQILLLSIWKEYILFALHPWPLCNYNNGYRKLLIMLILYDCFLFLEWRMNGFYHATNWDGVYGFLSLFFSAITLYPLSTFNLLVGCVSLKDLMKALFDTLYEYSSL